MAECWPGGCASPSSVVFWLIDRLWSEVKHNILRFGSTWNTIARIVPPIFPADDFHPPPQLPDTFLAGYKQAVTDILIYIRLNGKQHLVQYLEGKERACQ